MKNTISILFVLVSCFMHAQNSGIKGLVTGGDTTEPLMFATVTVGTSGTSTDLDGSFSYDLAPGQYEVKVSYVGYDDMVLNIDVQEGQYAEINAGLKETSSLLEQVTVTGSKFEKKVTDSPVSISVLTPDWVESTNTTDVSDIIDKTPGVQIIDGQANIRGGAGWTFGAGSRVMLLVDDIPALQADAGRPNWGDIPVENIGQIEIIKGASSVLYGSSALNGIIHVRTKYPTSTPETKIATSYTTFLDPPEALGANTKWWGGDSGVSTPFEWMVSGLHKQKFGKLDVVVNGFYSTEASYLQRDQSQVEPDELPGGMESDRLRLGANVKYRISDRVTFKLNGLFTNAHSEGHFVWDASPSSQGFYNPLNGAFTEGDNLRYYIDPELVVFDKAGNRHKLFARFYFINNENNNDQSNTSFTSYGEYQFLRNFENLGMNLTSGIYTSSASTDSPLFGGKPVDERNIAAYAQIDKKFGEKINFTIGGRLENFRQESDQFLDAGRDVNFESETKAIGRLGLTYELTDYTFLRASFGQGYRYPTIAERFITTSIGQFGIFPNIDLQSESGWSAEVGAKQGWQIGKVQGFIDAAAFWSQYQDMMEFNFVAGTDPGFTALNVGDTDIKGVEFNVVGNTNLGKMPFTFLAGYTYIDPTYTNINIEDCSVHDDEDIRSLCNSLTTDENVLKYRSKHNIKADFETGYKGFRIGTTIARVSNVVNVDQFLSNLFQIGAFREQYNDGYLTFDARLSYQINYSKKKEQRVAKLSIVGKNLSNEIYAHRPGIVQPPTNISVRLESSF